MKNALVIFQVLALGLFFLVSGFVERKQRRIEILFFCKDNGWEDTIIYRHVRAYLAAMSDLAFFPLALFFLEQVAYISSLILTVNQFRKTAYRSYSLLAIGFIVAIIGSWMRFLAIFEQETGRAVVHIQFANFFLLAGVTSWLIGFIYFRQDKLPLYAVFIGFLGGFVSAALVFSRDVVIYWDEFSHNWNPRYPPYFFLLFGPIILLSIVEIVRPLILKTKQLTREEDKKVLKIMTIGFILILLWGFLTLFTFNKWVRSLRPFLLSLGWLIWAFGANKQPLILSFTTSRPIALIVFSSRDASAFYFHRFESSDEQEYAEELVAPLLQALRAATTEIFGRKGDRRVYQLEDKLVLHRSIREKKVETALIAYSYDRSLQATFDYFVYLLSQREELDPYETIDLLPEIEGAFGSLSVIDEEAPELIS